MCCNIYRSKHYRACGSHGDFVGTQVMKADKLWSETVSRRTTRDCVCVVNSPRSFFSFEKESNFLRRDFLRLRISVREEKKKRHSHHK